MNRVFSLVALVLALGLIVFLYQRLRATEEALQQANRRFTDCEQVNFQLQNQLVAATRKPTPDSLKVRN